MIGKKWRRILIFSIIMCLNACGNTLCTKDEMLQAMKNEQNISGEIVECGSIVLDDIDITKNTKKPILITH